MTTKHTGLLWPDGKAYFFTEDRYVRYDATADAVEPGYPRRIADGWPGLFDRDIDAALLGVRGERAYFFQGDQYVAWDVAADKVVEGYPKPIADSWPGIFATVDAAVRWTDGTTAYLFGGTEYVKYDLATDTVAEGYPRPVADGWPGLLDGDVDAVVLWADGASAYVFQGDEYTKWDVAADTVVEGYPRLIADGWTGLPIGPLTDAPLPPPASDTPVAVENPGGGRIKDKTEPAASDLVTVEGNGGAKVPLHYLAARFWGLLVEAARADGIADPLLLPLSGYRSVASQQAIWEQALAKYGSEAEASKWVARPGGSAHHSGRAVDCWLGTGPNSENAPGQRKTAAWAWLVANAARFGFYPYDVEPWHWEYNPPAG
jgi:hypothetical protein